MIPMAKHPRYRTALLTFMPARSSRKRALVKNRLKFIDPTQQYQQGGVPDLAPQPPVGNHSQNFWRSAPNIGPARSYQTTSKELTRVMNRLKATVQSLTGQQ
jgi:hypothetical protein